jgi:hypothetical protein
VQDGSLGHGLDERDYGNGQDGDVQDDWQNHYHGHCLGQGYAYNQMQELGQHHDDVLDPEYDQSQEGAQYQEYVQGTGQAYNQSHESSRGEDDGKQESNSQGQANNQGHAYQYGHDHGSDSESQQSAGPYVQVLDNAGFAMENSQYGIDNGFELASGQKEGSGEVYFDAEETPDHHQKVSKLFIHNAHLYNCEPDVSVLAQRVTGL